MPLNLNEVDKFEKIAGQMDGLHKEVSALAKKSPNDALNKFKLKFVNAALNDANSILEPKYKPLSDFDQFDVDDLPTNSDLAFIVALYIEELERKRADNIRHDRPGYWIYNLSDSQDSIRTAPPKKIQEKK